MGSDPSNPQGSFGFGPPQAGQAAPAGFGNTAGTAPKVASAPVSPAAAKSTSGAPAASTTTGPADAAKAAPRKPARFLTPRERLPKGLPDWFLEKDVHGNGQVTMAEYTEHWTAEAAEEFAKYDLNHDGIITAAECLKVEQQRAGSKDSK